MMCASQAGKRGRRVLLLDHSYKLGSKILISGGGRCNFTNLGASPLQYVSNNPHFCKSALSRFTPEDFIQMVREHGIAFHEKKLGQLFCDESAQNIVNLLKDECQKAGVQFQLECNVLNVHSSGTQPPDRFTVETSAGIFHSNSLVVATGGLSIPKIGASPFGYEIARQFGLKIVPTVPALDGFKFKNEEVQSFNKLAGLSIDCSITAKGIHSGPITFRENLLFTHTGLSGPAALQASLHWKSGDPIQIDLLPDVNCFQWFMNKKQEGSRAQVKNLLSELLPNRFAEQFCDLYFPSLLPLPQVSEKSLLSFCQKLKAWTLTPSGTVGYSKAEVTRGGVDTDELSSKTLEAKKVPGLYFIGEVVDVTGWLGGYNFQWAWSSGWAAGQVV